MSPTGASLQSRSMKKQAAGADVAELGATTALMELARSMAGGWTASAKLIGSYT
jgi:hypothetical protein